MRQRLAERLPSVGNDLGRIAPRAKADVVIIDLRTTRYGPVRDPINALVEYGSGADVETVMVDGEIVVERGDRRDQRPGAFRPGRGRRQSRLEQLGRA
jgi:cytosine/adenosine deaminase-related metal-dependent hydrolase